MSDLLLAVQYLWKNPHRVSRDFLKKKGEKNIYAYGETPLTTLDQIAKECRILSKDSFYELGCGSGRTCLWMQLFVRCHVVGVEYLPTFIHRAQRVKQWIGLSNILFLKENMLSIDISGATVIYLYGTCLEEKIIEQLVEKFKGLPSQAKVITVSYPLTDYCEGFFEVAKQFTARFPWGKAEVFLNVKKYSLIN